MPLLSKRIFNCAKPLTGVKTEDKVFTITHTKEQFRSKDEYDKRVELYKKRIWTCQSTGHVNLTHEEAWNSEKTVIKTLKEQFPPCYDKPVLELVHHSTQSLECLVDQTWLMLQQVLVVGEKVNLKVKSGKTMKAIVVKVDKAGVDANPTSNCSSPSSDKENSERDDNISPKKWVPPKLLPYKYSIRFENEDSVIHSVPAGDLSRGDKPPSKELLRLFIRTYAVRAGQAPNSPWIVDDGQVKKLDLQSKFQSFLLSPVKWRPDEITKKINEEVKNNVSPSKVSPRIKPKMDAKEEKRREKASKSLKKITEKTEKVKAAQKRKSDVIAVDSSDSESDIPLSVAIKKKKSLSGSAKKVNNSDSDTPLAAMKDQVTPSKKKKGSDKEKEKETSGKNKSKKPLSLAELKRQMDKKKKKDKPKGKKDKKSKKGLDPKQLTLLEISKKKFAKTPEKKEKLSPKQKTPVKDQKTPEKKMPFKSPPRTPVIVQKIQKALKKDDRVAAGVYVTQAAKMLTSAQRSRLPEGIKERVDKRFAAIQEKQKMALMSDAEKKAYLAEHAAKRKKEVREKYREMRKNRNKRCEDNKLDLEPLPPPKVVPTPDGIPNEIFGDVTMVTEFISCFSGLLMPDDEYPIYTDALLKALAAGKDGFTYLCRVLIVLLQTLLQDQISEDYQEIKVPLSDIPVNPCTTSELVRLCLRKQDVVDDKSDVSEESEDIETDEVREELVQMLESQELFQLESEQKLEILKGLCLRVMATYSVQDYMEEKQQELTKLWKEKIINMKEDRSKKLAKLAERKLTEKSENGAAGKEAPEPSNLLLTSFYGKKGDEISTSGNTSETGMDVDDEDDLVSKLKRRRITAAKQQEEKKKREMEKRILLEKELLLQKEQKEKEQFENKFNEGMYFARVTQRQVPIGTDRNHSRYWVFSDITPGLYVEKGWAGEEMQYTCRTEGEEDFEDSSSSSGSDDDGGDDNGDQPIMPGRRGKPAKVQKCLDTTFPHQGQNLWFLYDNMKDVDTLIESLHPNGSRESRLKKELQRRYSDISSAIFKLRRSNNELRDCDGDKEMMDSFKKELMETEMRLRNGGLGGVDDYQTWCVRLETAVGVPALSDCLLETQQYVVEKFRDGIMAAKHKKSEVKEEEEEDGEEQVPEVAPGIQRWREAVKSSNTLSRLHVLLGILDSCIKWEKSAENAKCKICRKKGDEDRLLLCDDCNQAFHMYCLRPAITIVPQGDWHCPACAPQYRKRCADVPGRYTAQMVQDEDTDEDDAIKAAKTKSIKHESNCAGCGGDEDLIECAECPGVYHLECHDPPLRHPPRGRWVCNDCKTGVTRRKKGRSTSRKVAQKRKVVVESSSESEDEETEEEEEENSDTEEDTKPPPKKQQRASAGSSRGRKKSESPKGRRQSKGRRSAPSPDVDLMPSKVSRRAPSELSMMEDIINRMLDYKHAWPFYHMVSKRDVPDYYDIIRQPISFQKIKDRLNCLVYGSPQEVIDAVALLFRNAVEYNKIGSEVYDCIETSEKYFVDQLKKYLPFYAYNRDTLTNGHFETSPRGDGRRSSRGK